MPSIPQQISHLFLPPQNLQSKDLTFKSAVEIVNRHRIARIVKAAAFALASIIATACLALSEAKVIAWPLLIPAGIITLVAGAIFFRLNSLDKRYREGLDDETRSSLAKKELERIFLGKEVLASKEITKSLKDVNRLLSSEIFDKEEIEKILSLNETSLNLDSAVQDDKIAQDFELESRFNQKKSIAEIGQEQHMPIAISLAAERTEHGLYGLPSYQYQVEVKWDGTPESSIAIKYLSKEVSTESKTEESLPEKNEDLTAETTDTTLIQDSYISLTG